MIRFYFDHMILISFTTSIVIAMLLVLSKAIKHQYYSKWKYIAWILIAIHLLIPVPLVIKNPPVQLSTALAATALEKTQSAIALNAQSATAPLPRSKILETSPKLDWMDYCFRLWWVVTLAILIFTGIRSALAFKKLKRWHKAPLTTDTAVFEQVKNAVGYEHKIQLYRNPCIKSPLLMGIFNPVILLPDCPYTDMDLQLILNHEIHHQKGHHLPIKLLLFLTRTIYWFNPLVHLMSKDLDQALEMVCDESVIQNSDGIYKKRYMETIMSCIQNEFNSLSPFTTYYFGGKKSMKLRFENILDTPYKRKGYGVISLFAILALMILTMVACAPDEQAASAASAEIPPAGTDTQPASETAAEATTTAKTASVLMPALNEGIKGVLAESTPLPELEKTIIKALEIPADNLATTKYYYNYVDLNADGVDELFVLVMGSYTSGTGGSTALHVLDAKDGYIVNQTFTIMNEPIIISDKMTKGCHEIIVYRSGGGAEGTYIAMASSDGQYQTVNEGTPLDSLEGVKGTAIISNDILKDIENSTYLPLGQ